MSRQLVDAALAELSRAFAKLYSGWPAVDPAGTAASGAAGWCQNNTNSRWAIEARTVVSTGRSAVILRQHTTPFRPMIVPLMIWSLSSAPDGVDLQEGVVHATRRTYVPTGLSDPGIVVRTGGWRTCVNTSLNRKLAGRIRPNAARVKCCDPTSTAG
jgi:hypothetical protein